MVWRDERTYCKSDKSLGCYPDTRIGNEFCSEHEIVYGVYSNRIGLAARKGSFWKRNCERKGEARGLRAAVTWDGPRGRPLCLDVGLLLAHSLELARELAHEAA